MEHAIRSLARRDVLAALPALPFLLAGCATGRGASGGRAAPLVVERPALGTTFRVLVHADDADAALAAVARAFARVDALDALLSDYDAESELSRLGARSDDGAPTPPVPVSEPLFEVLACAQSVARATGGAFDVTVGPYVRLWRRARRRDELPEAHLLAEAARAVGHDKLLLDADARTVILLAPRMRLDLGGIAKGYVLDEMLAVLAEDGVERALVDGGGDLVASGPPPGRDGWRVALEPFGDDARADAEVALGHAALATSGDAFRFVELAGARWGHVVDPSTGLGVATRVAASVRARGPRCGMRADAWASALVVLGPERGLPLVESDPTLEARCGTVERTRATYGW